ncbi:MULTISPECIES: response regulator transcription factor [Chryseobacterium]|jgi:DNA-binding NarL/FixJ family response regulator|uniref:DNA-binding NarL/FixJ family response regulator n=1 Tax=Chryseobacterium geocarposphaerae TaxID=1416776 RepID=A0ABU1LDL5_9FLAO|nr:MULTISPECIES: response regulator transcription factor [Chryseobacterium]ALR32565.1 LuxR family transcriptional regulator [Chryseobacterium sp. IHB B 17019]MDR6404813.1 DNA-binding NarL/FixJ family response regulator [Chryseobacterium geocarposphaerae]MDR6697955.1 DNA-binding NarL/FixJ family response regulator [Chryseobacterium ginsenosidimutans]
MKNILIADGHYVVRTGTALLLESKLQYHCNIDFAETYFETKEKVSKKLYDLLIIDIDIPESIFKAMVKELKRKQKLLKILIFSTYDENVGIQYIEEGAAGYLNKGASEFEILASVSAILEEGYFYTVNMMKKLVTHSTGSHSVERLSKREFQIFKLLAEGNGNIEISNILNLKMSTISTYKKKIFEKLQVKNVVDLVRIYDDMH